jgi:hypothetical protein
MNKWFMILYLFMYVFIHIREISSLTYHGNEEGHRAIILSSAFFLKKMFRGTLSLTQENHNFIVQIGKNKSSQ